MPAGRPTDYSPEYVSDLLARVSCGEALHKICAEDGYPAKTTVFRWMYLHPEFRDKYHEAKAAAESAIAEEIFEILDEVPPAMASGATDSGYVTWAKNRADARKWYLSKIAPRRYGDRIEQTLQGPGGESLNVGITFVKTGQPS